MKEFVIFSLGLRVVNFDILETALSFWLSLSLIFFNPLVPNASFVYPLKTSENLMIS